VVKMECDFCKNSEARRKVEIVCDGKIEVRNLCPECFKKTFKIHVVEDVLRVD
jgi:hypothetical protein